MYNVYRVIRVISGILLIIFFNYLFFKINTTKNILDENIFIIFYGLRASSFFMFLFFNVYLESN